MKVSMLPIEYRIDCYGGPQPVKGFAVRLPAPFDRLRCCVRRAAGEWVIDQYDSGRSIHGPIVHVFDSDRQKLAYMKKWQRDTRTRQRAVAWLVRWLRECRRSGKMKRAFKRSGLGHILAEAGL